ncbi:transcription factor bHLH92 [Trifolium pratense]|uniref:transcription factor bHLH92 n=1 Tax=Trifolium pratense TaxID=57577 RepID=UPI001E6945F1|nr:transcription factor bHLH92 [Trifolium pratense]
MDPFYPENLLGEVFFDEPLTSNQSDYAMAQQQPCPTQNPSAFVQYRDQPKISFLEENSNTMNKRMVAFLKKSLPLEKNKVAECERERGFKHMISERMRRQKQRQCCSNLHSVLPKGTKTDNNSVVQTAAKEIQRLQGYKDELERKNFVLEENVEVIERRKPHYLRVPYDATSGIISSMIETLKLLKSNGVETTSIKSKFSQQELFAFLEIETEIAETVVDNIADEIDWKLQHKIPEGSHKQII